MSKAQKEVHKAFYRIDRYFRRRNLTEAAMYLFNAFILFKKNLEQKNERKKND